MDIDPQHPQDPSYTSHPQTCIHDQLHNNSTGIDKTILYAGLCELYAMLVCQDT